VSTIADITPSATSVPVKAGERATVTFDVVSKNRQRMTFGARLIVTPGLPPSWLSLEGGADRQVGPGETIRYSVTIAPPADTSNGTQSFSLQVFDQSEPGERFDESANVSLAISAAPKVVPLQPLQRRGWKITAIAAVTTLLLNSVAGVCWAALMNEFDRGSIGVGRFIFIPLAMGLVNAGMVAIAVRLSKSWRYCGILFSVGFAILLLVVPAAPSQLIGGMLLVPYLYQIRRLYRLARRQE
jgi:hypothetical protein